MIKGSASARCGISMKGVDIVVHGSVGHVGAFMAQRGTLVVCGDAGDDLGRLDLRDARLRPGRGRGPGRGLHREGDAATSTAPSSAAAERPGRPTFDPAEFRRYGSARRLYNFNVDNAGDY